ncbi:MAG: SH3 domain-containing protein, partial [Candidatus Binatia bacterium]
MTMKSTFHWTSIALFCLSLMACKTNEETAHSEEPLDINTVTRFYVTLETTRVKTGPGREFRTIGEIKQDSKVRVVGRDGDWLLIVSKKGAAPGFIEMASAKPSQDPKPESSATAAGKYETL